MEKEILIKKRLDASNQKGSQEYSKLLESTNEAPPYLFLRGNPQLLNKRIVSVVGSRLASTIGKEKAYRGLPKTQIIVKIN